VVLKTISYFTGALLATVTLIFFATLSLDKAATRELVVTVTGLEPTLGQDLSASLDSMASEIR
jgi:hypothetical protein